MRRERSQELNFRNLSPTIKHEGGSIMVWGCISSKEVGELVFTDVIMDKNRYLDILKQNLKRSVTAVDIENTLFLS